MLSELDTGLCVSEEVIPGRGVDTRRCANKDARPQRGWILWDPASIGERN